MTTEHGHKDITIIVNGRPKNVPKEELTFDEIITLAFATPPTGPNVVITVTYHRGHGDKPEGTLLPDGSVKVKEGMVFDVTATDKS